MKTDIYKQNIRKIRTYSRSFGLKINIGKYEESHYRSGEMVINIDSRNSRTNVLIYLLHELGHHIDDHLHPSTVDSYSKRVIFFKESRRAEELDTLDRKRLVIAGKITNKTVRKIIIKMTKMYPILLSKREERTLQEFRNDKRNGLSKREKKVLIHPYPYFIKGNLLTDEEKSDLLFIEKRAWYYGEKIGKMLNIKIPKTYRKIQRETLSDYRRLT